MNIIHVADIKDILSKNYEVIFTFHSEEALKALISALHNANVQWANGRVMCYENYNPSSNVLPRSIRVNRRAASTGSIEFYYAHWPATRKYRVVL